MTNCIFNTSLTAHLNLLLKLYQSGRVKMLPGQLIQMLYVIQVLNARNDQV